jgi:hypothetical protein
MRAAAAGTPSRSWTGIRAASPARGATRSPRRRWTEGFPLAPGSAAARAWGRRSAMDSHSLVCGRLFFLLLRRLRPVREASVPAPSVSTGGSTASALPMGAERDREPRADNLREGRWGLGRGVAVRVGPIGPALGLGPPGGAPRDEGCRVRREGAGGAAGLVGRRLLSGGRRAGWGVGGLGGRWRLGGDRRWVESESHLGHLPDNPRKLHTEGCLDAKTFEIWLL